MPFDINQKDLTDPNLSRLNQSLSQLSSRISTLEGSTGPINITAATTATSFATKSTQTLASVGPNTLITKSLADTLYGPKAQLIALTTGNYVSGPVQSISGLTGAANGSAYGTHANRPISQGNGSLYYETDRMALYQAQLISGAPEWVWIAGLMSGTYSSGLPSGLGQYDNGFLFYGTNSYVVYEWTWNSMTSTGAWNPVMEVWALLEDTAAHLVNYPAADYQPGTLYFETDHKVYYIVTVIATVNTWVYAFGVMTGTTISVDQRPSGLGTNDTGFTFYSTDAMLTYKWSGTGWVLYFSYTPILLDTHANRLANYPASRYAKGQLFLESDRSALYIVNSTPAWELVSSSMTGVDSGKPSGLGTTDAGFQYNATDTLIIYIWSGSAWDAFSGGGGYATATGGSVVLTNSLATACATGIPKAGRYVVIGSFDFTVTGSGDAGQVLFGSLSGGGANASLSGAVGTEATVSQTWVTGVLSAVSIITLVAAKTGGTGSSTLNSSTVTAIWVSAT